MNVRYPFMEPNINQRAAKTSTVIKMVVAGFPLLMITFVRITHHTITRSKESFTRSPIARHLTVARPRHLAAASQKSKFLLGVK